MYYNTYKYVCQPPGITKSTGNSPVLSFACIRQYAFLRSGNLAGTQAAGAGVNTAGFAVDDCLDLHNVGLPSSVGTSVRVGNLDPESDVLTAEITFSHFLHLLLIFT